MPEFSSTPILLDAAGDISGNYRLEIMAKPESGLDEPWTEAACTAHHPYNRAKEFAIEYLGSGKGRPCLVIGSPLFEATAIRDAGWDVTFFDVRQPPATDLRVVLGDAISLPFPDGTFDGLSSTCVLCHVGLGRYGDEVVDDGDDLALREMWRVLRPNGIATIMFGPTFPTLRKTIVLGTTHRVYRIEDVLEKVQALGFAAGPPRLSGDGIIFTMAEAEAQIRADVKAAMKPGQPFGVLYYYLMVAVRKV